MSQTYTVVNPYNGEQIGQFNFANADEVNLALSKLQRGKAKLIQIPVFERSTILHKLADLIEENKEDLARLITREIGKTLQDSRIEVQRSANTARCSAEECKRQSGEVLDSDAYPPMRAKWGVVHRRPLGVVLAITPFNFPINLALHKIGPAFAAGCPLFFKPTPQCYFSGKRLTELCYEAGFPEEAIQFCVPDVPEISEVVQGDQVQIISFTGGVPTAKAIAKDAGFKKLLFELGGNDPLIVMDDGDIKKAVQTAIQQRFGTAGQRCTAAKRLFIHSDVYDDFKAELVAATEALVVGDPAQEETFVGPVINEHAARVIEQRIQDAVAEGATLLTGGKRDGNLIYPTVLEGVSPESEIVKDETFGPVIPLFRFNHVEEIVPIINGTEFGLQSGVFTNKLDVIRYLFDALEVGTLAVNDGPGFRAEHFPFGGVKNSGIGREGVRYAIEEMTYQKMLVM